MILELWYSCIAGGAIAASLGNVYSQWLWNWPKSVIRLRFLVAILNSIRFWERTNYHQFPWVCTSKSKSVLNHRIYATRTLNIFLKYHGATYCQGIDIWPKPLVYLKCMLEYVQDSKGLAYIPLAILWLRVCLVRSQSQGVAEHHFLGGGVSVSQLVRALPWHAKNMGAKSIRGLWVLVLLGGRNNPTFMLRQ